MDGTGLAPGAAMRLDGSIIDVAETETLTEAEMNEESGGGIGLESEQMDLGADVEEPLTPATDNTGSSKSLPGSGRETPASQSDQSATFSSSEKSTPSQKLKPIDLAGRQIEFDNASTSSGSIKTVHFPQRTGISWRKGEKLEAMDYLNTWFPAKIKEINEEEQQVLIHFDGWNQRYDEWIDMNSDRIRPLVRHSERKDKTKRVKGTKCPLLHQDHKVGDKVYAKWTDCKMYPAKITNILPSGSYEVIFYDGFKKLVQPINIRPMLGEPKSFEIHPVPESVLKKAKLKLDMSDTSSPETSNRSRSSEKQKSESGREKAKRKRQTFDGTDLASIANSLEKPPPEEMALIRSEPVSTQTEYTHRKDVDHGKLLADSGSAVDFSVQTAAVGLPPKAFVVQSDHNPYKCHYDECNKGFRKKHLLDYHIKYYHMREEDVQPPPAKKKKRRKTISTCSTESDSASKKCAGKKNRNLSAEGALYPVVVKQEGLDSSFPPAPDSDDLGIEASPVKQADSYASEDSSLGVKTEIKSEAGGTEESSVTDAEDFLKPDELVNCICDYQEENGLMIQCEVCMCWQHAACFGISERTLPKTYVCFVCENPPGVRESSRYIHEQDWFKTGEIVSFNYLPVAAMTEEKCSTVKATHSLVAEIRQLNRVLHSLKLQLKILRTKDESKLKQWRLDWDVMEPWKETLETCPTEDKKDQLSSHTHDTSNLAETGHKQTADTDKSQGGRADGNDVEKEEKPEGQNILTELNEGATDIANATVTSDSEEKRTEEKQEDSVAADVNSSSADSRTDIVDMADRNGPIVNISKADSNDITHTTQSASQPVLKQAVGERKAEGEAEETMHSDSTESVVEDPLEVCEKNLLSHILRVQADISDKLDKIEEEVTMLEAMEACQARRDPVDSQHILGDMPQLKRSMKTLYADLTKVKKMAVFH